MLALQVSKSLALSLICLSLCILAQSKSEGAIVHVKIVDHSGRDLGEATIDEFKSNRDGANFATRFHHNTASGLPFAVYHLRAHATGFYTVERDVRVFQPDVLVTLGLDLGLEGGPLTYKVSGNIRGRGHDKGPFMIRLSGVYSGVLMDSATNSEDNFEISGIPQGIYVLIVSQAGQVLDVRPINIPASAPILIEVGAEKSRGRVAQPRAFDFAGGPPVRF